VTKTTATAHSKILLLDFGSQYTQVIARRIRECQVYSEIVRFNIPADEVAELAPKGIVLSGGPASVYDEKAPQLDPKIFSLGIPVLGICYGMQLMAHHLGGQVEFSNRREYGAGILHIANGSRLFDGVGPQIDIWCSHGDKVTALPSGFRSAAATENAPFAAMEDSARNLYALQFHPDVTHAMMHRWTTRGHVRLEMPGAKPRAAHFADREVYDYSVRAWLSVFLERWIGS
jgi:GMP synthase (glutamine-hydrolysing)